MSVSVSTPLPKALRVWLWSIWGLVLLMVIVGGTTRLTGSGLSMVEWHPLMGSLPPMSESAWEAVFERYRAFPQYQQVNHWMELSDFKRIFFWEYVHRLLGRLLGLAFFLPWLAFVVRGQLRGRWVARTFAALCLGGAQGLLGWYMVRSGLVDRPEVSHLRLAAHLSLAFVAGLWVMWLALDGGGAQRPVAPAFDGADARRVRARLLKAAWGLVALVALQVVYGAFMAGTNAGLVAATFPDMNGHYGPAPFFTGGSVWGDAVNNPLAIHWIHRVLGFCVVVGALWLLVAVRASGQPTWRRWALGVVHLVGLQFVLGAATVVLQVPTALAVAHQACAYLLMSALVRLCHALGAADREFAQA